MLTIVKFVVLFCASTVFCAPSSPHLPTYDIWGTSSISKRTNSESTIEEVEQRINFNETARNGKVLNFFPVPVDDECLSVDGRRAGICLNAYECRMQNGDSKGPCALGFGVCCVFTATCGQEVYNNLTYIVSPGFPGLSRDPKSCEIKIKMIHPDISQLRLDFIHFHMGQPNRRTGVCDGDLFLLSGGAAPEFKLCGQNSGQHIYFDVDGARSDPVSILLNMTNRSFPRMWEIRVSQIPFNQRAPSGCLQYFSGTAGLIQTMNFAENGRHLADQHYRACVRQEVGMCSIAYEPCDENSFRIGSGPAGTAGTGGVLGAAGGGGAPGLPGSPVGTLSDTAGVAPGGAFGPGGAGSPLADPQAAGTGDTPAVTTNDANDASSDALADDLEGSGDALAAPRTGSSYESLAFTGRQMLPTLQCLDRITMPCIVEDFIATGAAAPSLCEPTHCGSSLCVGGQFPCRLESSVTPFGLGIHFGPGVEKGSPEDNLGACLRYQQVPCTG